MALDVNAVANSILQKGQRDAVSIDPMKLQKLMYLAHGWHLLFLQNPLIAQSIEAWSYGPVIPKLYTEFKEFKAAPITRTATILPGTLTTSGLEESLLESVWATYKDKSGIYLSMLTHEPGYAWDIARRASRWYSPVIPNELILDEFTRRHQAAVAAAK
jgi:uncharacterized phage-associated protein